METLEGVASLLSSVLSLPSFSEKECFSVGSCNRFPSENSLGEGRKICLLARLVALLLSHRECSWELFSLANSGSVYSFTTIFFTDYCFCKLNSAFSTSC